MSSTYPTAPLDGSAQGQGGRVHAQKYLVKIVPNSVTNSGTPYTIPRTITFDATSNPNVVVPLFTSDLVYQGKLLVTNASGTNGQVQSIEYQLPESSDLFLSVYGGPTGLSTKNLESTTLNQISTVDSVANRVSFSRRHIGDTFEFKIHHSFTTSGPSTLGFPVQFTFAPSTPINVTQIQGSLYTFNLSGPLTPYGNQNVTLAQGTMTFFVQFTGWVDSSVSGVPSCVPIFKVW